MTAGLDFGGLPRDHQRRSEADFQTPIAVSSDLSSPATRSRRSEQPAVVLGASANFVPARRGEQGSEFAGQALQGRANYFYIRTDASSRTILPKNFLAARCASAGPVLRSSPVISNEQFSIGGADGPRGYLEAAELGDYGVKGTFKFGAPTRYSPPAPCTSTASCSSMPAWCRSCDPLEDQNSKFDPAAGVSVRLRRVRPAARRATSTYAQALADSANTAASRLAPALSRSLGVVMNEEQKD